MFAFPLDTPRRCRCGETSWPHREKYFQLFGQMLKWLDLRRKELGCIWTFQSSTNETKNRFLWNYEFESSTFSSHQMTEFFSRIRHSAKQQRLSNDKLARKDECKVCSKTKIAKERVIDIQNYHVNFKQTSHNRHSTKTVFFFSSIAQMCSPIQA